MKAADKDVKYTSSDTTLATVDKNGTVRVQKTAKIGEKVTITVTTSDGHCTDQLVVTVTP